jgi:hypothetical protein
MTDRNGAASTTAPDSAGQPRSCREGALSATDANEKTGAEPCRPQIEKFKQEGIPARVVSVSSWELFEQQDPVYRDAVLPPDVTARVSVEEARSLGAIAMSAGPAP